MKLRTLSKVAFATCAVLFSGTAFAAELGQNPNATRWSEGTIVYRTIETQRVRAHESWRLTAHPDGSRTIRSFVDNFDAESQLNMIHRVAKDFRPLESLVTYWSKGNYRGSGMFSVDGPTLTATLSGPHGPLTETLDVPEKFSMVPHPLATDSWHTWYFDKAKGGAQTTTLYNVQIAAPSDTPALGRLENGTMTFEGVEEVTVPAGTFTTDHYTMNDSIHVWVSGPDNMMVRYAMPTRDLEYVLTSLKTGATK
jgi:hypothetical protein